MHLPAGRVPDVRGDGARHGVPYGGAAGKHFFPLSSVLFVAPSQKQLGRLGGSSGSWRSQTTTAHSSLPGSAQTPQSKSVPDVAPLQGFDPELVLPQLEMYTREK